jgi:lysophospholipase L1-like esterase
MAVGDSICRQTVSLVFDRFLRQPAKPVGLARGSWETADHQCRSGWSANHLSGAATPTVNPGGLNAVQATQALRPDVTYVMAGLNDLNRGASGPEAAEHLGELLVRMMDANPAGRYLLSTEPSGDDRTAALNLRVPGVVAQLRAAHRDVHFVDVAKHLTRADYVYPPGIPDDLVHPNDVGDAKVARWLAEALDPLVQAAAVANTSTVLGPYRTTHAETWDSLARRLYPDRGSLPAGQVRAALIRSNQQERAWLPGYEPPGVRYSRTVPKGTVIYLPPSLRVWRHG